KRYQLRFTLFMVIVSAVLMVGLGWWVMRVADSATHVQRERISGEKCPPVPKIGALQIEGVTDVAPAAGAGSASAGSGGSDDDFRPPRRVAPAGSDDDPGGAGSGRSSASGAGSASAGAGSASHVGAGAGSPVAVPAPTGEPVECKTDADCPPNMACHDD